MPVNPIFYIYPLSKWVSFNTIAEHHVKELRKYFRVEKIDETALTTIMPIATLSAKSLFFIQPYFYPIQIYEKKLLSLIGKPKRLIGVDVADSTSITKEAVHLTEYAEALIVPSNFSRNAYIKSGVKKPVYAIPHGVDEEYIKAPKSNPTTFKPLNEYKTKTKKKLIQTWVLHSEYRKGLDLAYKIVNTLLKERNDVAFVLRTGIATHVISKPFQTNPTLDITLTTLWLTDQQIMELMDTCDIYLLTSRGGGFEHPPLLALARGEPAIGAKGGAWQDYLPEWALVPSHPSDIVLKDNPIHNGVGVEMETEKAVNLLNNILDNLNDYKAKVQEHIDKRIKQDLTWDKIGLKLKEVALKHM